MIAAPREIYGKVNKYGKLNKEAQYCLESVIARGAGRDVAITIKYPTKTRSNAENRFYWGVVIPLIKEMFEEAGNVVDSDEVHCYLRAHVGKLVNRIVMPDGTTKNVLKSSTKLTTMEFEDYLTKVRVWAAEQGVIIPMPNEEIQANHEGRA